MYSQRLRQLLRSSRSFIRRRDRAWRGPVLRLGAWADDIRRSLRVRSRWVSRHVDRRCSYYQGTTTLQVALLLMMTVLPVTPSNEGSSWHTRSNHDFRRPHGSRCRGALPLSRAGERGQRPLRLLRVPLTHGSGRTVRGSATVS